jgi:glutamate dehydrogenase/leucine dehydrogenase
MRELLTKFENKKPEIVFEWNDPETEACGWVVINSLRGGSAGGGTRMRVGLDKREVESLAKTMEVKFTVSGPPIGGAKSGINFDPNDPRKTAVLKRWYKAVYPLLKNYYGTGGDLNIDEIEEVIPITEDFGLWHPQEGVVNGHYQANEPLKIKMLGQLRTGVAKVVEDHHYTPALERKYTVADLITGYGVAQSVIHFYELWGGDLSQKQAVIQGWGNVGAAAAYYLAGEGVKVVGIIDKDGGIVNQEGFSFQEIKELYLNRNGNKLVVDNMLSYEEVNDRIWDLNAEIFIPAAASRLLTKEQVDKMIATDLEVISSGANVPFADPEIFFGPIAEFADKNIAIIPDFIANCGMARVFAYLMSGEVEITDKSIFEDTSSTIKKALKDLYKVNPNKTGLATTAFEIALAKLV